MEEDSHSPAFLLSYNHHQHHQPRFVSHKMTRRMSCLFIHRFFLNTKHDGPLQVPPTWKLSLLSLQNTRNSDYPKKMEWERNTTTMYRDDEECCHCRSFSSIHVYFFLFFFVFFHFSACWIQQLIHFGLFSFMSHGFNVRVAVFRENRELLQWQRYKSLSSINFK